MIAIAFYTARGNWWNRLIRWWTGSPYSHCELVIGKRGHKGLCWSSSNRDGGVRTKSIAVYDGHWDVIDLPWADPAKIAAARQLFAGARYDWLGVFLFAFGFHAKKRWFCSEICATALGISNGHNYSPATLRTLVLDINQLSFNRS